MNKLIFFKQYCLFAFLVSFYSLTSYANGQPSRTSLDSIAALVNGSVISVSDLNNETNFLEKRITASNNMAPPRNELMRHVLDKMIMDKIQLQLANKTGIQIDEVLLDQQLAAIAADEQLTIVQFQDKLAKEGLPFNYVRNSVRQELTLSRLHSREIGSRITISQQEIDYFLRSPEGQNKMGQEYLVGHILISLPEAPTTAHIKKAKQQAEAIIEKLKAGEDFAKLSMTHSQSPQALAGGNLGWRKMAQLPTLFVAPVSQLAVQGVAPPLRSPSGFHVIQLLDKRTGEGAVEKISKSHVQHILIKTDAMHSNDDAEMKLQHLRDLAIQGERFENLAKTHSQDLGSASQGGDLGFTTPDSFVPEFRDVIDTLAIGEISQPFKTAFGWHIAKVIARKDETTGDAVVENKARRLIYQRKFEERLEAWQRQMKEEAYVKIILPGYEQS